MIKAIVMGLLFLGLTIQVCDKGCLKCNARNECLLCDTVHKYVLSGTNCVLSSLNNCSILTYNGECVKCNADYYLDASTKKCVAIQSSRLVTNCLVYGVDQACTLCIKNYYVKDNSCVPVTFFIEYCDFYSANGFCSQCASGYFFNANRDKCISKATISNCDAYTYIGCKSCATGFVDNANFYFVSYQNPAVISADITSFLVTGNKDWTPLNRCQKIKDPNCLIASVYDECQKCAAGYFLTSSKTCKAYPSEIIPGCVSYNSLTSCVECNQGYYLESSSKCTLITPDKFITNCVAYDSKASNIACTQCVPSKYLAGGTCASDRVDSIIIQNCKSNKFDADACAECSDGFKITNDGKKCLPLIPNCATYNNSSVIDRLLSCQACNPKYYLNVVDNITSCVAGAIEGCLSYSSKDLCSGCDRALYYLNNNGSCIKHPVVANCVQYNGSSSGVCSTCSTGYYPFRISDTCQSVSPLIENCISYNPSTSKCVTCASGYYLKNDNTCVSLSTVAFCKEATAAGKCAQCIDKYARYSASESCAPNHDYILNSCASVSPNATFKLSNQPESSQCAVCKENSYPFDLGSYYSCLKDSVITDSRGVTNKITNCKRYSNDSTSQCLECNLGYFLLISNDDTQRSCVTTCDPATYTNLIEDPINKVINTCQTQSNAYTYAMQNCAVATIAYISGARTKICIKLGSAATSFILGVDSLYNDVENLSLSRDLKDSSVPQPIDAFLYYGSQIKILANTNAKHDTVVPADSPYALTPDNLACELWNIKNANSYCWRCKWGFTVKYDNAADKTFCLKLATCNTAVSYGGFSSTLNQLLSCHGCTDTSQVLALHINLEGTATAGQLKILGLVNNVNSLQCQSSNTSAHSTTSPKEIANCQVYASSYVTGTFSVNHSGCVACRPGYKPGSADQVFTSCVKIDNCDSGKSILVNRCAFCSQVNTDNTPRYRAFPNWNLQSCDPANTENCLLVGSSQQGSDYVCTVCRPGYWLNLDKRCEKITLPNCKNSESIVFHKWDSIDQTVISDYYTIKRLAKVNSIQGCDSCDAGYVAFMMPTGERQCVGSSYVAQNAYSTFSSKYIQDCLRYKNEYVGTNTIPTTCAACISGRVISQDGSKCVSLPSHPQCIIAQNSGSSCYSCSSGYVAVNGACRTKNIPYCASYDESSIVSDVLCSICNDGYVLSSDKKLCTIGKVFGCKIYQINSPYVCSACLNGFNRISSANGKTYCLKFIDGSNCQTFDLTNETGLQSGQYKCSACLSNNSAAFVPKAYAVSDIGLPQSICLPLNPVDKCIKYDVSSSTVNSNSYWCVECETGYYASEDINQCVQRVNVSPNCSIYELTKDKCKTCSSSSFLNAAATDCVSFPNGIFGCAIYANETACEKCKTSRYLNSNSCVLSTVIDRCEEYSGNYTCTKCQAGYFLTNSTLCEKAIADNCYTYVSIRECASCDPNNPNKGLKTNYGITNCVDKNVANCAISTAKEPFTCTQCNQGYYLNSNSICQAVPSAIRRCLVYDSENTCTLCEQGSVLAIDRKSCNDQNLAPYNDVNCKDSVVLNEPACSKCQLGYFFSNGTCTACDKRLNAGCLSCDPVNQTACLACSPGYYQTVNSTCVFWAQPAINIVGSAVLARMFGVLTLLAFLLI